MASAQQLPTATIHNLIFASVKKRCALGNSKRGFKEVASDLLNATGLSTTEIANGTFLCASTVARVMDCEEHYAPRADTLERVFRFCNAECTFEEVPIKAGYMNKPKDA